MAIRSARETFSKDDVIEILRRNVTLYKNEPEFVEYIVNLALYLIDQAYCLGGERSSDLESVLEHFEIIRERRQEGAGDDELIEDIADSPTRKLLSEMVEPVMKAPPPPMEEEEMDMTTDQMKALELQRMRHEPSQSERRQDAEDKRRVPHYVEPDTQKMSAPDIEELGEDDEPRTKRLFSPGALTPIPEGGLTNRQSGTEKAKIEVNQQGKTRVYRVVRSYSASEGDLLVCPICGADTKGDRRCPSCGHIV